MDKFGYIYYPKQCIANEQEPNRAFVKCDLLIYLHGCKEDVIDIGRGKYGFSKIASANDIIILYP